MKAKPQLEQSMQEEQIRKALNAHWHASAVDDANAEHDIYDDDAICDYSQSGDSNPLLDFPVISSFRALTRFISAHIGPATWTPNSAARRVMCAAYAEATSVFVGMQPVLTHVPPKRPR
jgi:hypothetical protein